MLVSTFVTFLIEAALLIALGRAALPRRVARRGRSRCFFALVLGAAAFAAMGLGLTGFVRSAEGSSAVVNFVYLPMAIISGTFFSPQGYPPFLRAIANVLPLTYFTEADARRDGARPPPLVETRALAVVLSGARSASSPRSAASAGSRASELSRSTASSVRARLPLRRSRRDLTGEPVEQAAQVQLGAPGHHGRIAVGARSKRDVTSAPPPCACSAACSGGAARAPRSGS